ncbi:Aldo/keto reductase [Annulohypoxylon maeteangense]|uniref:Aldo/keto reductase n=1 Tax=Annulohypoxylon maeteangense TaxID=1927788 RepID=UPI0020072869|nr:Aldo/keto reductase [Annulohypoxylon maeteangense]KAI0882023.1 Aldo/keto reductase [Annulohypoxylon maeteangense]
MPSHPQLIFGGASIGAAFATPQEVSELLQTLKSLGVKRIDTAARYPPTNPGASERLLGELGATKLGFLIDTKVLCAGLGEGSLEPAATQKSLVESYERLQLQDSKVNVLHCHRPDTQTPLIEQAEGLNAQYRAGRFDKLGVSNFDPELLDEFIKICDQNGYVKPTVYQGQYNLVCRDIERTLFPTLRKHGMVFNAYSPLAGGFLNGKLTAGDTEGTRFDAGNVMGQHYRAQYDKKEMHDGIEYLTNILDEMGISKVEASLRWISYHSSLGSDDGIILGASKLSQLSQNVEAIAKGPLDEKVVSAMDKMWQSISG